MASTSIPAVEAAVISILEASEALADVTISRDGPPERSDEYLCLYKAEAKRPEFRLLGGQPPQIEEEISLYAMIQVIRGAGIDPSREWAFEVLEAAETALRADLKLGLTVWKSIITDITGDPVSFDDKRGFRVRFTIEATARI